MIRKQMASRFIRSLTAIFLSLLGCSLISSPSLLAVITVPTDAATIQAGIDLANPGDTVRVLAGTYIGPGNKGIDFAGKDVVLMSTSGADSTILDLQASNRAFDFNSGETRSCVVDGFTIRYGKVSIGGAVLCQDASPTLTDCVFESNVAGAIDPSGAGGAIYCSGAACSLMVNDCVFTSNWALWGGAMCGESGAYIDVRHSDFIGNNAINGLGGAICLQGNSKAYLFNCTFDSCSADYGGALEASNGSDFLGSIALFSRNLATLGGAAIDVSDDSHAYLDRVTMALGQSTISASGIRCGDQSSVIMEQTIIAHGITGPAVSLDGISSSATFYCSDIYGNAGGDWVGGISGQLSINDNFSSDPLFCDTASGNYRTQGVSLCSNALSPCGDWVGALESSCPCCTTSRGNVNNDPDNSIDISDLTFLVNYFFKQGSEPNCVGQSDINWDLGLSVADITYLVSFMFKSGPAPPPCL